MEFMCWRWELVRPNASGKVERATSRSLHGSNLNIRPSRKPVVSWECWLGPNCRISDNSTVCQVALSIPGLCLLRPHRNTWTYRTVHKYCSQGLDGCMRWQVPWQLTTLTANGNIFGRVCFLTGRWTAFALWNLARLNVKYWVICNWYQFQSNIVYEISTKVTAPLQRLLLQLQAEQGLQRSAWTVLGGFHRYKASSGCFLFCFTVA